MRKGKSRKNKNSKRYIIMLSLVGIFIILLAFPATRNGLQWVYYRIYDKIIRHGPMNQQKVTDIGVPIPDLYSLHGIDVSRYQNLIDWQRVKAFTSGPFAVSFVFIKATEGQGMVDPYFNTNWKGSAEAQIPRGAYHFFIPSRDPVAQANNFVRYVEMKQGDLPPVLDVESNGGVSKEQIVQNTLTWLRLVEAHYGVRPIVYTGANFYDLYFRGTEVEKYPIWIAHYYMDEPEFSGKWTFWQHTDRARIDGIEGLVDLNVFAGSKEQFQNLLKK